MTDDIVIVTRAEDGTPGSSASAARTLAPVSTPPAPDDER